MLFNGSRCNYSTKFIRCVCRKLWPGSKKVRKKNFYHKGQIQCHKDILERASFEKSFQIWSLFIQRLKMYANIKVTTETQADENTNRQTRQKQCVPDHSIRAHQSYFLCHPISILYIHMGVDPSCLLSVVFKLHAELVEVPVLSSTIQISYARHSDNLLI